MGMTVEIGESFVRPVRIIPSTVPWTTVCTLTLQTWPAQGEGAGLQRLAQHLLNQILPQRDYNHSKKALSWFHQSLFKDLSKT